MPKLRRQVCNIFAMSLEKSLEWSWFFCIQVNIKVFHKLILLFLTNVTRYSESTQDTLSDKAMSDKIFRWTKFSSRSENFVTFVRRKILSNEKFCPFLIFLISFKHLLFIIYSVKINVINKMLCPEQIYFPISYQR